MGPRQHYKMSEKAEALKTNRFVCVICSNKHPCIAHDYINRKRCTTCEHTVGLTCGRCPICSKDQKDTKDSKRT